MIKKEEEENIKKKKKKIGVKGFFQQPRAHANLN